MEWLKENKLLSGEHDIFVHLFLIENLRSDHSFAEAITDLHQINVVKNLGEGRGEAKGVKSKVS